MEHRGDFQTYRSICAEQFNPYTETWKKSTASLYKEIWDEKRRDKGSEGLPCVCVCVSLGRVCSLYLCECMHVSLRGEANLLLCSTARGIQTDRQQEQE